MTIQAQNSVKLFLKSGETVSYSFSKKPVMTYSGSDLVVSSSKVEVVYPLCTISKMCFEYDITGIDKTTKADLRFSLSGNIIVVEGEKAKTDITIYDLKGTAVKKSMTDGEGRTEISIYDLVKGIYIVKTVSVSFKIYKP